MFLSKPSTIFILLAAFFSASCGSCSTPDNQNTNSFIAEEIKSNIPFSTKEPNIFQADIIVTANGAERKYLIARNGKNRLTVFNRGAQAEVSVLQNEDGQTFIIDAENKTYKESDSAGHNNSNDLTEYLTTGWLNQRTEAVFTKIGTENDLTKYSVKLAQSDSSEILIFFDENLQVTVRQEFYAVYNGQKNLTFTVEVRNFQAQTSENLFTIPEDFKNKK